jgi:hypothetical protein
MALNSKTSKHIVDVVSSPYWILYQDFNSDHAPVIWVWDCKPTENVIKSLVNIVKLAPENDHITRDSFKLFKEDIKQPWSIPISKLITGRADTFKYVRAETKH